MDFDDELRLAKFLLPSIGFTAGTVVFIVLERDNPFLYVFALISILCWWMFFDVLRHMLRKSKAEQPTFPISSLGQVKKKPDGPRLFVPPSKD